VGTQHFPELDELSLGHKVWLDVVSYCDRNLRDIVLFIIAAHFFLAIYVDLCDDKS